MKALVLDFGGPVLKTPFEVLRGGEQRAGIAAGSLDWTGPFDPDADDDWRLQQSGVITERDYWQRKADQFGALTGRPATFPGLMGVLFDAPEDDLVRPGARDLILDAKSAGYVVAVCTNDLRAFHGDKGLDHLTILNQIDLLVDGSVEHVLKPDPAIYRLVTDRLGLTGQDCLFVDDQRGNVAGAAAVGMGAVWFDVVHPEGSYQQIRTLLEL